MAHGHRTMSDACGANRVFARTDAGEEVFHVLVPPACHARQSHSIGRQRFVEQRPITGLDIASAHPDPLVVFTLKKDAIGGDAVVFADWPTLGRPAAANQARPGGAIWAIAVSVGDLESWMAIIAIGPV